MNKVDPYGLEDALYFGFDIDAYVIYGGSLGFGVTRLAGGGWGFYVSYAHGWGLNAGVSASSGLSSTEDLNTEFEAEEYGVIFSQEDSYDPRTGRQTGVKWSLGADLGYSNSTGDGVASDCVWGCDARNSSQGNAAASTNGANGTNQSGTSGNVTRQQGLNAVQSSRSSIGNTLGGSRAKAAQAKAELNKAEQEIANCNADGECK